MSTYSIDRDKRLPLVGFIIAFSVILYYCIDYYAIAPFKPENSLTNILFFFLPASSLAIAWVITQILKPLIFKYCEICNVSGTYEGYLKTSWNNFKSDIPIKITINQTLFDITIALETDNSQSINNTAHIECGKKTKITYTYTNEGSVDELGLSMHMGTCIISISDGELSGMYYNGIGNRITQGTLKLMKNNTKF